MKSFKKIKWSGVMPAITTQFKKSGELDLKSFEYNLKAQIDAGVHGIIHGGPFPVSTDNRFTSVGPDSIYRWLRSISFQDCTQEILPDALKDSNPLELTRMINNKFNSKPL